MWHGNISEKMTLTFLNCPENPILSSFSLDCRQIYHVNLYHHSMRREEKSRKRNKLRSKAKHNQTHCGRRKWECKVKTQLWFWPWRAEADWISQACLLCPRLGERQCTENVSWHWEHLPAERPGEAALTGASYLPRSWKGACCHLRRRLLWGLAPLARPQETALMADFWTTHLKWRCIHEQASFMCRWGVEADEPYRSEH